MSTQGQEVIAMDAAVLSTDEAEAIALLGNQFGKLPREVIMKILEYAVVEGEAIKPEQRCKGSNKFVHGKFKTVVNQYGEQAKVSTEETKLAVPALMATCKTFYTILNESAVFYNKNCFEFSDEKSLLAYAASITPARLSDLRYIKFGYTAAMDIMISAGKLLSTCKALEEVTISCGETWGLYLPPISEGSWRYVKCRNLQIGFQTMEGGEIPVEKYTSGHLAYIVKCKSWASGPVFHPTEQELLEARQKSGVQLHGDGRLSGDAKPGLISSRTRAGRAKQARVNSDGVVEPEGQEKFNQAGQLNWGFLAIEDHRCSDDPDTQRPAVEFLVRWNNGVRRIGAGSTKLTSWETLENITSATDFRVFSSLCDYYHKKMLWGRLDGAKHIFDAAVEHDRLKILEGSFVSRRKHGGVRCTHQGANIITCLKHGVECHEKYLKAAAAKAEAVAAKAEGVAAALAAANGTANKAPGPRKRSTTKTGKGGNGADATATTTPAVASKKRKLA